MQEIKKRRIVIASVLKPVNDPRMFEKMGVSLSQDYEVHIFGTDATTTVKFDSVYLHPLSAYRRLSVDRLVSPLKIFKKIIGLRPALVIICTHELLWMVLFAKLFTGCRVIYDIRENYFRNILYTNAFPPIIRHLVALYVRMKEPTSTSFIDRFFFAEAGYASELSFPYGKSIVIENRLRRVHLSPTVKWSTVDKNIHLLFTGTLAPSTGIFVAIELAKNLQARDKKIRLHIIGFSPKHSTRKEITDRIQGCKFIEFHEHLQPVPHNDIVRAIQMADFGIISYPSNPSTENTIPTKLFEYLGYSLPILLIDRPVWTSLCKPWPAAITFDGTKPDVDTILHEIHTKGFYVTEPTDVFWETEEKKLLQTVSEEVNKLS
jgi:glycosyltransferase involved in cell wall biosynthesis